MNSTHRVLITGATGAIGPRIVQAFLDTGNYVRSFSIDDPPGSGWNAAVDTRYGDITDYQSVVDAMQDVDIVIHLAALLHILNPPPGLRDQYERINVGGTKKIVAAAQEAGVRRIVFASTIAVYGASQNQILDESSIPDPDTFYAKTKLQAERIVLSSKNMDDEPMGVVLRFGAVYGSGIKGNYQRLLDAIKKRRFIPLGSGKNRRTLIYDKDLAQAVVIAATHPKAAGRIFNVTDGEYHTLSEIISAISLSLGRTPPRLSIPITPVKWLAGVIHTITKAFRLPTIIDRGTIDKYTEDIAVCGDAMQTELGFVPAYDLLSGWQDAIKEMNSVENSNG